MYNLSFDRMVKMFEGERTQKQLKNKFEKEMRDHPDMVHRALSTQITKGPWWRGERGVLSSLWDSWGAVWKGWGSGRVGSLGIGSNRVGRGRVGSALGGVACGAVTPGTPLPPTRLDQTV